MFRAAKKTEESVLPFRPKRPGPFPRVRTSRTPFPAPAQSCTNSVRKRPNSCSAAGLLSSRNAASGSTSATGSGIDPRPRPRRRTSWAGDPLRTRRRPRNGSPRVSGSKTVTSTSSNDASNAVTSTVTCCIFEMTSSGMNDILT